MEFTSSFVEKRYIFLENIISIAHLSVPLVLLVLFVVWVFRKNSKVRWTGGVLVVGTLIFIYSFYIERFWIKTNNMELDRGWDARVVLIADQHLGVFKDADYMTQVVEKINGIPDVDFVVIAGDFTYWPVDLEDEHHALQDIDVPVYAVLGNHDVLQSGMISHKEELLNVLEPIGVNVLENDIVETDSGVIIYGLGNHWGHIDDVNLLVDAKPEEENILILTHNPDTTSKTYPDVDLSNTVTMTGHTHCGQIRIPGLYKHVIPTVGDFPHRGPYDLGRKGTLLITCGLGEVGLPLRLFNRPEIMVVDL